MFRTILLPLDGSQLAERALPYAKTLAQRAGGRIVLVRAEPASDTPFETEPDHRRNGADGAERAGGSTAAAEYLANVAIALMGVPVEPLLLHDQPGDAILRAVSTAKADAIVMTTHGRSGFGRWLYGTVADHVLHHADVPVLLVPAACNYVWDGAIPGVPRRVLVPLDGSPFAEEILPAASQLTGILEAEIDVLRVVDVPSTISQDYVQTAELSEMLSSQEVEAQRYVETMAGQLRAAGGVVTPHVEVGWAPTVIADAARGRHSCAIAMATHGRTGIARVVLGSVATATLQRAHVPLLLVRPPQLKAQREVGENTGAGHASH